MLEDVLDVLIRSVTIYSAVNAMGYLHCVRSSMENNHFVQDWKDHARIGSEHFMSQFRTARYQILPLDYVGIFNVDKFIQKITPWISGD